MLQIILDCNNMLIFVLKYSRYFQNIPVLFPNIIKIDEIYTSNYLINYILSLFANILDILFQKHMLICFYPKYRRDKYPYVYMSVLQIHVFFYS